MRTRVRTALLAMLLAAPALASVRAAAQQGERLEVEVVRTLRTLRDPRHPPLESMADDLVRHARGVPDFLFEILRDGRVPDRGEGAQVLSIYQRDLILLSFERLGRSETLASLARFVTEPEAMSERIATVEILGAVGRKNDFERVLDLTLGPEEEELAEAMASAFRRATCGILKRDGDAFRMVAETWQSIRSELLVHLILAVGDTRDPRGLEFLSGVAFWKADLADAAVAQIQSIGPSQDESLNEELRVRLRAQLDPEQPDRCRTICMALAALEDVSALPQLIEYLRHEAKGLRSSAHWALKRLTGLGFAADPARWSHWYAAEVQWLQRDKNKAFRRLLSNNHGDAARALQEIEQHPLARNELLVALPSLFESPKAPIRILACRAAAELGRPEIIEPLIDALEDPSTEVAKAALQALQKVTGLDLPEDASAWRERFSA